MAEARSRPPQANGATKGNARKRAPGIGKRGICLAAAFVGGKCTAKNAVAGGRRGAVPVGERDLVRVPARGGEPRKRWAWPGLPRPEGALRQVAMKDLPKGDRPRSRQKREGLPREYAARRAW